jgi:16S rRNA processing protein RimM
VLLEVGRIGRPHGVRGEVVVTLVTDRTERVSPGVVLDAGGRDLRIETSRRHQDKWLVAFEGVHDRDAAAALGGTVLRAEALPAGADELWVHELVGAEVTEVNGRRRGRVVEVQANPASDLLVLDDGALVPVTFVVAHEPGASVTIDPPDGLFDL